MSWLAFALASTLLKGDVSLEKRVKTLSPFFKPAPGETLSLNETEIRDLGKKIKPSKLRGQIVVSPPKGTCLTVQRSSEDSDDVVCKKTTLTFQYSQLDKNGQLNWQVSTGEGDFGTPLHWQSPYRVGIVTPFDKSLDDPPQYRFIKTCEASNDPEKGRRIVLTLVDGESWIIRFPEKDALLLQPDPLPNLYTNMNSGKKTSVKDAEANNKAKAEAEAKEPPKVEKAEGGEQGEEKPAEQPRPKDEDDRMDWAVPRRGTYTMAASNFQPFGSVAPGMKGECRYNYKGPDEDPHTGRIECHEVDGFKQVFIPLTCLATLRQDK